MRGGGRRCAAYAEPTDVYRVHTGAGWNRFNGIAQPSRVQRFEAVQRAWLFFNHYERGELIDLYHQSEFYQAENEEIRGVRQDFPVAQDLHVRRVLKHVDTGLVRDREISGRAGCG
jgi:hypothetical protein